MAISEEISTGAKRLDWSVEDKDHFFSEEGNENADDGWDDGFDSDEDLGTSPEREKVDDSCDPNSDFRSVSEDDAMDATGTADVMTMDAKDAPDQHKSDDGSSPSFTATLAPKNFLSSPNPPPSLNLPPISASFPTLNKEGASSKRMTGISAESKGPTGPKALSTIYGIVGSSTDTPLSQARSIATPMTAPLVEVEEDEKFEEIVRKRNRVRKEREDYHIAHIKVQMGRLEEALAAETKRRVDATTVLDELARIQVKEMEDRVRGQLREENEKLQTRLCTLEERVRLLEENWVLDSNNQIELVNTKAADLSKSISQIRNDQNMERKARLKREGILLQQVEGHAKEAKERWTSERNDRITRIKELEDSIIRNEARLALEQKRYEERIEKELTSLKEELDVEVAERQTQDEEIVAALNRYTQQLQHSLSILSSD